MEGYLERSRAALGKAITAAGIPLDGISGFPPNLRIDFGAGATADQVNQGIQIASGWDWSEAAQTTRDTQDARQAALAGFFTNTDPTSVAVRCIVRDLYTDCNDCREWVAALYAEINTLRAALNLSPVTIPAAAYRTQESEIVARLQAEMNAGLGDA